MKGTIKCIKEDKDEILVQPDHDSVITVEANSENLIYLGLGFFETDVGRKDLLHNSSERVVGCFVGDRIKYRKSGNSSHEVQRLLVKKGDPRCGHPSVEIE